MRYTSLGLALLLLGVAGNRSVQAQSVIVPTANAASNGNTFTLIPFADNAWTFQIDYASSQLSAIAPGTSLTSLGFREASGSSTGPGSPITFSNFQITLSHSNNSLWALSSTFANNIGGDAVQVYNASLTIAANALVGGTGPNPFYDIVFATPYTYTGGDLLITLQHTNSGSGLNPLLDANGVDSNASTVGAYGSANAATGGVGFYNYPIVRLGTAAPISMSTPEPGSVALLVGMSLSGAGFLARRRKLTRQAA